MKEKMLLEKLSFMEFQHTPLTADQRAMLVKSAEKVLHELQKQNHSLTGVYNQLLIEAKEYEWFNPVNFKCVLIEADGCVSEDAFNALYEVLEQLADNESECIDGGSSSSI